MDKTISEKIKALRISKGYSQGHLADLAQLNLRTIQRIESGDTEARGDSLNRIAASLGVAVEIFTESLAGAPADVMKEDKIYLIFMNLSALAFVFYAFPFLGILIPVIMWLMRKDKIKGVREEGRKLINFQLTWLLFSALIYGVVILSLVFHIRIIPFEFSLGAGLGGPESILIDILFLPGINLVFIVFNTIRIALNKPVWYKPAIRFIKAK